MGSDADNVRMFRTGTHACGYWADREARDLVLDPRDPRLPQLYPMALDWGFRRSGDIVYRPSCVGCQACVAVRVPVATFRPDRDLVPSQRGPHPGLGGPQSGSRLVDPQPTLHVQLIRQRTYTSNTLQPVSRRTSHHFFQHFLQKYFHLPQHQY